MFVPVSLSTAKMFMVFLPFFTKLVLTEMCFVFKKPLKAATFHYWAFFSCYVELAGRFFHVVSRDLATWFSLSSMRFRWITHRFDFEYLSIRIHILRCFAAAITLWGTRMLLSTWKSAGTCWIILKSISGTFWSISDFAAHVPLLFTLRKYFSKKVYFEHLEKECPFFKQMFCKNNSRSRVLIVLVF